ncbi:MAG: low affinity iron permease family protein, partial [Ferruginibacter sp.]
MATYNLLFTTRTQLGYHPVGTKPRDWLLPGKNWQLVINTGTTIITFLMVFLIQKSQNKEAMAVQLKLNELVAAHEFAS